MDEKCKLCKNREEMCNDSMSMRNLCKRNGFDAFSPVTNADKIRQMSDEGLAMLLQPTCPPGEECPSVGGIKDCYKCWMDWLKQEVAE